MRIPHHFFLILFFSILLAGCNPQPQSNTLPTSQISADHEPSPTEQDLPTEIGTPTSTETDSDNDGWQDMIDLCPQESSPDGLAGCQSLNLPLTTAHYTAWYHLPIDTAGRIGTAGDRLLVLTNYQENTLSIHDLADGTLLRRLNIPDLLNDSATLLQQGILLKNYDQQHWRLLDYSGQELFAADEELEIINQTYHVLVSRADNLIFIRNLDDLQTNPTQLSGIFVGLDNTGQNLTIMDPETCVLTLYALTGDQKPETWSFGPESGYCYQSARFTFDGNHLFFTENGNTNIVSLSDLSNQRTYSGIPLAVLSDGLLLLSDNYLISLNISTAQMQLITRLRTDNLRGIVLGPDEAWIAIRSNKPDQPSTNWITIYSLPSGQALTSFQADTLQFIAEKPVIWSFGDNKIAFLSGATFQEEKQLSSAPLLGVQSALNGKLLLVSGQDNQLYVYGGEGK